MQKAVVKAIEYYLPKAVLDNEVLAQKFPDFSAEKILAKTGIKERHISGVDECSSDMAVHAAEKLLQTNVIAKEQIDVVTIAVPTKYHKKVALACIAKGINILLEG